MFNRLDEERDGHRLMYVRIFHRSSGRSFERTYFKRRNLKNTTYVLLPARPYVYVAVYTLQNQAQNLGFLF